jgi:hypothetical protein
MCIYDFVDIIILRISRWMALMFHVACWTVAMFKRVRYVCKHNCMELIHIAFLMKIRQKDLLIHSIHLILTQDRKHRRTPQYELILRQKYYLRHCTQTGSEFYQVGTGVMLPEREADHSPPSTAEV